MTRDICLEKFQRFRGFSWDMVVAFLMKSLVEGRGLQFLKKSPKLVYTFYDQKADQTSCETLSLPLGKTGFSQSRHNSERFT